jgi:predicted N-formylglutamate amidohydrolase
MCLKETMLKKLAQNNVRQLKKVASDMDAALEALRQELTQIENDANISDEEKDAKIDEWIERYHKAADDYLAKREQV